MPLTVNRHPLRSRDLRLKINRITSPLTHLPQCRVLTSIWSQPTFHIIVLVNINCHLCFLYLESIKWVTVPSLNKPTQDFFKLIFTCNINHKWSLYGHLVVYVDSFGDIDDSMSSKSYGKKETISDYECGTNIGSLCSHNIPCIKSIDKYNSYMGTQKMEATAAAGPRAQI